MPDVMACLHVQVAAGGFGLGNERLGSVEVYQPTPAAGPHVMGTWAALPPMSMPRAEFGCCCLTAGEVRCIPVKHEIASTKFLYIPYYIVLYMQSVLII